MKIHPSIRSEIALDSGEDDVFGWGVFHMFDVAFALHFRGEDIPPEWKFSPGSVRVDEACADSPTLIALLDMYDDDEITADDLRVAGNVLSRYVGHVKFHGKDY